MTAGVGGVTGVGFVVAAGDAAAGAVACETAAGFVLDAAGGTAVGAAGLLASWTTGFAAAGGDFAGPLYTENGELHGSGEYGVMGPSAVARAKGLFGSGSA